MRILYTKPELVDISQSSRIAFARQFRFMTQDDVSDKLGLTGFPSFTAISINFPTPS